MILFFGSKTLVYMFSEIFRQDKQDVFKKAMITIRCRVEMLNGGRLQCVHEV